MLAAGFPWAWAVDYHGLSSVNSVSIAGVILGQDRFRLVPFLGDILLYAMAGFVLVLAIARSRRSPLSLILPF